MLLKRLLTILYRNEVLKMQGEQAAKMKDLEDQLLNKISSVQGNILDDDSVIKTLERIKGEAKQLNLAIEQTKEILEEVKTVSNLYVPLAAVMTAVYFSLEGLSDIYFLYQYSLQVGFQVLVIGPRGLYASKITLLVRLVLV